MNKSHKKFLEELTKYANTPIADFRDNYTEVYGFSNSGKTLNQIHNQERWQRPVIEVDKTSGWFTNPQGSRQFVKQGGVEWERSDNVLRYKIITEVRELSSVIVFEV